MTSVQTGLGGGYLSTVRGTVPWVPEPQNLNERKLVRGKERRKKLSFLPYFFLFIIFWLWYPG